MTEGLGVIFDGKAKMKKTAKIWGVPDDEARAWLEWRRFDDWLGVRRGMAVPITALAVAVLSQIVLVALQVFCLPCLRTIFGLLR